MSRVDRPRRERAPIEGAKPRDDAEAQHLALDGGARPSGGLKAPR